MKIVNLLIVIITGMVLAYGTMDMPDWGDPDSAASRHVSPEYISDAVEKTATPNIVTAVLADYRGYDTLGETAVIFSAGMACILLLRRKRKE
ncbi:MAG: hypothetical protein JRF60_00715 [Deltaproteobacteria bacterium]|nr:hypothetical protein [Deltaproteobacteria bacterium]